MNSSLAHRDQLRALAQNWKFAKIHVFAASRRQSWDSRLIALKADSRPLTWLRVSRTAKTNIKIQAVAKWTEPITCVTALNSHWWSVILNCADIYLPASRWPCHCSCWWWVNFVSWGPVEIKLNGTRNNFHILRMFKVHESGEIKTQFLECQDFFSNCVCSKNWIMESLPHRLFSPTWPCSWERPPSTGS